MPKGDGRKLTKLWSADMALGEDDMIDALDSSERWDRVSRALAGVPTRDAESIRAAFSVTNAPEVTAALMRAIERFEKQWRKQLKD